MSAKNYAPVLDNPLVKLDVTHSHLTFRIPEVKFSKLEPICEIKLSLVKRVGTSVDSMQLQLRNRQGQKVAEMDDDLKCLGYYSPEDGFSIHVIDLDPSSIVAQIGDVSKVEKYVMSDEDYEQLPTSMRKFLRNLRENNPELFAKSNIVTDPDFEKDIADNIKVGDRCMMVNDNHRGEVKYVGRCPDLGQGFYVGIKLDEPYGMNDGSVKGVKYFECSNKYGMFLRPSKILTGYYPELDIDELDEI